MADVIEIRKRLAREMPELARASNNSAPIRIQYIKRNSHAAHAAADSAARSHNRSTEGPTDALPKSTFSPRGVRRFAARKLREDLATSAVSRKAFAMHRDQETTGSGNG